MVESSCPTCGGPVLPDESRCARCGASLSGQAAGPESTRPGGEARANVHPTVDPEPYEDPRLTFVFDSPPDQNPLESLSGGSVPPSPDPEPPAWAMRPSSTGSSPGQPGASISLQLGARPISLASVGASAAPPGPAAAPATRVPWVSPPAPIPAAPEQLNQPETATAPTPAPAAEPFTTPTRPESPFAAPAAASAAPPPPETAPPAPARKESVQELVAFGLVAAGVSIGIASLFLAWAGATGIGIGTESIAGSPPPSNQWGWGMPAGFPLFLLSLPVLVAIAGSDRAQARFPKLALVVSRVTDLILPMILGGLYLGVAFMYLTVPASYGPGLYLGQLALILGAGLLIAGAVVTVFFPPEVHRTRG